MMFGLPGQGMHLRMDPLSALFLCILVPQMLAAALSGMRGSVVLWLFCASLALTLLAATPFTLVFGLGLAGTAAWLLMLRLERKAAAPYIGVALFSVACLIPAMFLPPGGLAFVLVLLGTGAMAGLAALPQGASVALSGGLMNVSVYVLIRYGFIAFGAATQPWWGLVLIIAGAACVLPGALGAILEVDMSAVLASTSLAQLGLTLVALGIALRAVAMHNPALAALALQAALLGTLAHALFRPMLIIGAGAVRHATGTNSLDWLGGLLRGMPRVGMLMLGAAAGMASLPLGPGFAPEFLLLHAVIAAAGTGAIFARIGFVALLAALGFSAALAVGAMVRLIGLGFLGRPRSLRAAAAEDTGGGTLAAMALLGVLCIPLALLPGVVLGALVPVIQLLAPQADPLPLAYAPLSLALLMALCGGGALLALRRFAVRGTREVVAWNGGFGRPPVWLPFGDPTTQPSATGFAEPVARAFGGWHPANAGGGLARLRRLRVRLSHAARRIPLPSPLALMLAALALCLLVLILGQGS